MARRAQIQNMQQQEWAAVFDEPRVPHERRLAVATAIAQNPDAHFVRTQTVRVPDNEGKVHEIGAVQYVEWLGAQAGRFGISYAGENPVPAEGQGPLPADYRNLPA